MNAGSPRSQLVTTGLVIAVLATALTGCRGELGSMERDLGRPEQVRIETGSVRVIVTRTLESARLEASVDSRRRVTVDELGPRLAIKVSRVRGGIAIAADEVVRLTVRDGTRLEVDTGSGSVDVVGLDLSNLGVSVGSGSVTIASVEGPVRVDTGSGSAILSDVTGDIRLDGGSGSVRLSDVAGQLDVETGSGSIDGRMVTLTGNSSFGAGSGSITLSFTNAESDLSFDLDAGSGSLSVGDRRASDRLRLGDGPVMVRSRTGSGSQAFRTQ